MSLNPWLDIDATSWRTSSELFTAETGCADINPGCIDMTPGWHQQGHHVGHLLYCQRYSILTMSQGPGHNLNISRHLKLITSAKPLWLLEATESIALISASMSILHPGLYAAGMQCMYLMSRKEPNADVRAMVAVWPSVFNAIQIIANREAPRHRDHRTRCEWFDILCTLGTYSSTNLLLDGLDLQLDYRPGTLVAISGRLLAHSVKRCPPDRVCYAFYMRDALHKRFVVENPGWMKLTSL